MFKRDEVDDITYIIKNRIEYIPYQKFRKKLRILQLRSDQGNRVK